MTRKSHKKLSSPHNGSSYELQTAPTKTVRLGNNTSRGIPYSWQDENGSRINIVPTNRILEVREMDMKFEDQGKNGRDKDEYGWSERRAAISTRTVL